MSSKTEILPLLQPVHVTFPLLSPTHINFTCNVLSDVFLTRYEIMLSPSKHVLHYDSTVAHHNALVIIIVGQTSRISKVLSVA